MPAKEAKSTQEAVARLRKKLAALAQDADPVTRRALRKRVKRAQRKARRLTRVVVAKASGS